VHTVRSTRGIKSLVWDEPTANWDPRLLKELIVLGDYVYVDHVNDWDPLRGPADPLPPDIPPTKLIGSMQTMPGVQPLTLAQGDPSAVSGGLIATPLPGGMVTDWPSLIRYGIDRWLGPGTPSGFQQPGPLVLPPGSPTPGLFPPGGLQTQPGFGGRGRTPFLTMPNGLPGCPAGYHPMKDGQPWCVRNRRMNPLNPRALSRATRRVGGFARAVKRARTIKAVCRSL